MTISSDNIYPKLILVEGAAPSSPAATNFKLYFDSSDHLLKWKNSAGTVTTVATGTSASVPGWMSWFTGTTTATDIYWDGNDLASFTTQTVTGSATWAENGGAVQVLATNQTADDVSAELIAQTISIGDSWVVAVNTMFIQNDSTNAASGSRFLGILMTDGTATTSNAVCGHIQIDNAATQLGLLVGRTGTLTNVNTAAPWVSNNQITGMGGWLFVKLKYSAANTFQLSFGPSPYQLSAMGEADISKTMTPSHVGIFVSNTSANGIALGMFGPMKKV